MPVLKGGMGLERTNRGEDQFLFCPVLPEIKHRNAFDVNNHKSFPVHTQDLRGRTSIALRAQLSQLYISIALSFLPDLSWPQR